MENKNSTYIIAEAGQNHNGSMKMAKQLIDMTAMPVMDKAFNLELEGINAIKFTKRDLTEELTKEAAEKVYDSPNAFARTYGEHREKLELSYEQHEELYHYSKDKELDFIETFTSPKTLKLLEKVDVKFIKVASRDLTNIQLIEEIGKTKVPVILSTGMGGVEEIDRSLDVITKYHENIVILHCLSQYPAEYKNLNLNSIPYLIERYPQYTIGYSDHSIGIVAPVLAIALGAKFIEKHITLNHSLKGSDHKSALEPEGLWRMVRDIRNMETAFGEKHKNISEVVAPFRKKLERSLAVKTKLSAGEVLTENHLIMLSPGGGMSWDEKDLILGKKACANIDELTNLKPEMFE